MIYIIAGLILLVIIQVYLSALIFRNRIEKLTKERDNLNLFTEKGKRRCIEINLEIDRLYEIE